MKNETSLELLTIPIVTSVGSCAYAGMPNARGRRGAAREGQRRAARGSMTMLSWSLRIQWYATGLIRSRGSMALGTT